AAAMAFNDAFLLQTYMFVGLIGLLWIIRRPPRRPGGREPRVELGH
ncbi:MAG: hypothetical protein HQK55_19645, partial [Deltaproteobacteria bacterium]|nr:hypothetical protein [Deltaproteobacteria bacterium]